MGKPQTWKSIRVNSVSILHSFKRIRAVFQENPEQAREMVEELRQLPTKWGARTIQKTIVNAATQTEEWPI